MAILVETRGNDAYRILGFCSLESIVKLKGIFLYKKGFKKPPLHPGERHVRNITKELEFIVQLPFLAYLVKCSEPTFGIPVIKTSEFSGTLRLAN